MTRPVEDNAIVLNLVAGSDGADLGARAAPTIDYRSALGESFAGLTIGVVRHFHERDGPADEEIAQAPDAAFAVLEDLSATLKDIELAPLEDYTSCNRTILSFESYRIHTRWLAERADEYGALARERIGNGASMSAENCADALARRVDLSEEMEQCLEGLDALVCASGMTPAYSIDDAHEIARSYMRHARTPFNVTGHPALAVPIGFSDHGLPLGMRIAGHVFSEAMLYRIGHAYEQACGWHRHHPGDLELAS